MTLSPLLAGLPSKGETELRVHLGDMASAFGALCDPHRLRDGYSRVNLRQYRQDDFHGSQDTGRILK